MNEATHRFERNGIDHRIGGGRDFEAVAMRLGEAAAVPVLILPVLGMFIVAVSGLMNRDD